MVDGPQTSLRFTSEPREQDRTIESSYVIQSFQEQRLVDAFIQSTKVIKIVQTAAESFVKNYQSSKRPEDTFNAIIVKLPLNYSDFLSSSTVLLYFLIEEPLQFENAIKYCVFSLLRTIVKDTSSDRKINIDIDQVHVLLRFEGIPIQKDLLFQPHSNLYRTGLSAVIGVVSAIAQPEKIVLQSVWYCSNGCDRNKIRTNILDAPSCINCKHPMKEYPKLRYTASSQLLRILPIESVETPRLLNKIFRSLTVRVAEHVFGCNLILGNRYLIIDSLRELSESQLETLLRYDSPPETPLEPTDATLKSHVTQEYLNTCNNDIEGNSCMAFNYRNTEEFISEIDFSILHHSPNLRLSLSPLNMQINENGSSIIVPNTGDTNKYPSGSIQDILDIKNFEDEYMELEKNENICATKPETLFKNQELAEYLSNDPRDSYKFPKLNEIFEKNEHFSNRKCQTQIKLNDCKENSHEKIISSCPPHAACNNDLYTKDSTSFFQEKVLDFHGTNSAGLPQRKNENECHNSPTSTHISFEKSICNHTAEMNDTFDKSQSQHKFSGLCSWQEQPPSKTVINLHNLFDDDKIAPHFTPQTTNLQIDVLSIPLAVRKLHDIVKLNHTDFAFIYALSSQLCQDRVPMECFVTLKIALLLSLVSIGNNENSPPIPIVAITNDTYMTDYLMSNIGQLGCRFLGPVEETKSSSNTNWIEADPILLAKGGVYYAGDWTRLKLRREDAIFKTIECSNVAVEKSTLTFSLETSIWTHWRSSKYGAKDQKAFNKFLKIFGIPIFVSDDNHEAVIDYTLEQSSIRVFESTVDHLSVNEDDMRQYLVSVSQTNVALSPEAALLLKNYFVASRSSRQECLSTQSYSMLKQFAESFAKLSMRKEVIPDDAVASIILCEHFIQNIFSGGSNLPPYFGNFTFVDTVDKYFVEFKQWLDSFIEKFIN